MRSASSPVSGARKNDRTESVENSVVMMAWLQSKLIPIGLMNTPKV